MFVKDPLGVYSCAMFSRASWSQPLHQVAATMTAGGVVPHIQGGRDLPSLGQDPTDAERVWLGAACGHLWASRERESVEAGCGSPQRKFLNVGDDRLGSTTWARSATLEPVMPGKPPVQISVTRGPMVATLSRFDA